MPTADELGRRHPLLIRLLASCAPVWQSLLAADEAALTAIARESTEAMAALAGLGRTALSLLSSHERGLPPIAEADTASLGSSPDLPPRRCSHNKAPATPGGAWYFADFDVLLRSSSASSSSTATSTTSLSPRTCTRTFCSHSCLLAFAFAPPTFINTPRNLMSLHYGGPQRHSSQSSHYSQRPPSVAYQQRPPSTQYGAPPPHGYGAPPPQPPYGRPPPSVGPPPGADPQLWQWFSAVDTDRSGAISVTELQAALVNGESFRFYAPLLSPAPFVVSPASGVRARVPRAIDADRVRSRTGNWTSECLYLPDVAHAAGASRGWVERRHLRPPRARAPSSIPRAFSYVACALGKPSGVPSGD